MRLSLLIPSAVFILLTTSTSTGQFFGLDDYPANPLTGPVGYGYGAENPYAVPAPGFPTGFAPSPSLGDMNCLDADILAAGPTIHHAVRWVCPGHGGAYTDGMSMNTVDYGRFVRLAFSVDRLSAGVRGDVHDQAKLNQQPGDVFRTTRVFFAPGNYRKVAGPAGFDPTPLAPPPAAGGIASNTLTFDESSFGLRAGNPVILTEDEVAPAIAHGTHDNIDQFEREAADADGDGLFDDWGYFTVYPDDTMSPDDPGNVVHSPSEIYDAAPGSLGTAELPFATSAQIGLHPIFDSIDALVVYDNGKPGGPSYDGPGAQPHVDYALFSLAPGSFSLIEERLCASDVFFTNFTGTFWVYAHGDELGLGEGYWGQPGIGCNVDALEVNESVDIDWDGEVDAEDLIRVLSQWGSTTPDDPADTDGDGRVGFSDLLGVYSAWGSAS